MSLLLYTYHLFIEYGNNMITKLADHYYPGPQHQNDCQQILAEWQKAKYDLLQWKKNDLPQIIREGAGSVTATDWCLSRLLQPTNRAHYPMLSFVAEVCFSCPVSNAWPERALSVLKWQKHRLHLCIKNDLLNHYFKSQPMVQSRTKKGTANTHAGKWSKSN